MSTNTAQKIEQSQHYIDQLRIQFPPLTNYQTEEKFVENLADLASLLRELSLPRTTVPVKFQQNFFTKRYFFQRILLKIWNLLDSPNRARFQQLAEQLDEIHKKYQVTKYQNN